MADNNAYILGTSNSYDLVTTLGSVRVSARVGGVGQNSCSWRDRV